jgi:hypothetical protein
MRRNGPALLLAATLTALAGCSAPAGADAAPRWHAVADIEAASPGNPAETASPSAGSSPAPGSAGSGSPGASAPGGTGPATGVSPGGTAPRAGGTGTSEDLRDGLLGAADVPAGFAPVAVASSHTGKVNIGGGNFPGCPALEPMTTDETSSAAVTYANGAMGPYLTHAIVRFPAGGAAEAMAQLRSTVAACQNFDQQLAGISVRFRVAATQPPAGLGDEAAGLRMTGTTDVGISVAADIVAARRGNHVIWLSDTTLGTAPAGFATGLAPAAAARCGQKLKGC